MKRRKVLIVVALIFILNSCASLGILSGAKSELDKGIALFNRSLHQEAIPHFEKALEINTDLTEAYLYLGKSYLKLGKWIKAFSPLRTALRLSPDNAKFEVISILVDALLGAASSEFKKGNFQASIGFLKQALELEPNSDRAVNELFKTLISYGEKLLSKGNATEAIGKFSEALKMSPDNVTAYLWLGKAFLKNGDFLKALQSVKDAIKIDPTNQNARSPLCQYK